MTRSRMPPGLPSPTMVYHSVESTAFGRRRKAGEQSQHGPSLNFGVVGQYGGRFCSSQRVTSRLEWRVREVILRTETGRVVTRAWMDLATAAMALPAGVILDGEAVVYRHGQLDFSAVRQRASAQPAQPP
ncbi:hypothetical protein [Streptomyces sp. NPDC059017]|uniref:hypothetical protein n=1 Tax=unclassified Streptomyces TaxID=2593676 RepID=UPI003675D37A